VSWGQPAPPYHAHEQHDAAALGAGQQGVQLGAQAVAPQLEFESKFEAKLKSDLSYFSFKALSYGRFQLGFHRVNLHRPTRAVCMWSSSDHHPKLTTL